jgi:hypothetical protein
VIDVLKITSSIPVKRKVHSIPGKFPSNAVFDLKNLNFSKNIKKAPITKLDIENDGRSLLKNLNKEIFEPILRSTGAQADSVRKLVLIARSFETIPGILSDTFVEKIFVRPDELLNELINWEKGSTIFKGKFFDKLRMLAKLEGEPNLKAAIVSILKHFDCYVHQSNSLKAIVMQAQNLADMLPKGEASQVRQQIGLLESMINQGNISQSEIKAYLMNEVIPMLGTIAKQYQGSDKIYNQVMAIVHYIVRYDKADPRLLEESVLLLIDNLRQMFSITDEDIIEIKKLVFESAAEEQKLADKYNEGTKLVEKHGLEAEKKDLAALLSESMGKSAPLKVNNLAQNLLMNLVQSESPLLPLLHFTIPFRFMDENTYGEFIVDKDCSERRGDAKEAKNIFFTIKSDKYGNFEVDILARDNIIDLDIRCPDDLVAPIKEIRDKWKDIIEEQGYRLARYHVGVYQESQTILLRYPKLAYGKAGLDVKV